MENPYVHAARTYTEKPRRDMFQLHLHENYELFCFLSGSAQYYVEGTIYPLKPHDILLLKVAESHALLIDKAIPYERIVISFNGDALVGNLKERIVSFLDTRPLGQQNKYSLLKQENGNLLFYLDKICTTEDIEEKRLYLTFVLNELSKKTPSEPNQEITDSIGEVIEYINGHLFEDISLDMLSEKFYLSKVHLTRKFKSYVGTTIWEYISTKRLIKAKELLKGGKWPTDVAEACGFNDYSTFYRAYKQKYGISPKEDCVKI